MRLDGPGHRIGQSRAMDWSIQNALMFIRRPLLKLQMTFVENYVQEVIQIGVIYKTENNSNGELNLQSQISATLSI